MGTNEFQLLYFGVCVSSIWTVGPLARNKDTTGRSARRSRWLSQWLRVMLRSCRLSRQQYRGRCHGHEESKFQVRTGAFVSGRVFCLLRSLRGRGLASWLQASAIARRIREETLRTLCMRQCLLPINRTPKHWQTQPVLPLQYTEVTEVKGWVEREYLSLHRSPTLTQRIHVATLHGIYLGPEVGIWELLWALSIYHVGTWTLWVGVAPTPSKCRSGEPVIRDLRFSVLGLQFNFLLPAKNNGETNGKEHRRNGN